MGHNLPLRTRRLLARGIGPRMARHWGAAPFLSLGIGNRASRAFGTGNSAYTIYARQPGTAGNAITFAVVVAGNNTAASVTVVGNAVTFNSATNGSGAATSTVWNLRNAVNSDAVARSLVFATSATGSDSSGTVAAQTALALTGGV